MIDLNSADSFNTGTVGCVPTFPQPVDYGWPWQPSHEPVLTKKTVTKTTKKDDKGRVTEEIVVEEYEYGPPYKVTYGTTTTSPVLRQSSDTGSIEYGQSISPAF